MSDFKPTLSPVRIYVLWHPKFAEGLALARRIYYWFRLETMEGIPVFFRSGSGPESRTPPGVPDDCPINYIIPLVEAHMVACPYWRAYVAAFAEPVASRNSTDRLYPVAMDPSRIKGDRRGVEAEILCKPKRGASGSYQPHPRSGNGRSHPGCPD
jgi:hypothetical protein